MTDSCVANEYFSGQGSVLIATKNTTTGEPEGFVPVGNVSALTIGVETTIFEHKESCSGVRGIDKEIVQEIKVTVAMTMESINKENLALTLYGSDAEVTAGAASDEEVIAYLGKWQRMDNIKVDTVVVGDDAVPTISYVLGDNYLINEEAGSIYFMTTAAQTAASAANLITEAQTIFLDYNFLQYDNIEGIISSAAPERWIRFEGLNTADNDKPVIIDIYKMSIKPLAELALINEELAEMAVEGGALSDATRAAGSKYFTIKKVA